MAMVQNNRPHPDKEQALHRVPLKRLMREKPMEAAPIKKRVMAALNLSCKKESLSLSSTLKPIIKTEHMEKDSSFLGCGRDLSYQQDSKAKDGQESALDLSPALRHTLAQFTLSSQCSLGGPAAFSGQHSQDKLAPLLTQANVGGGPLLVPPDSSTELVVCNLEGETISCFSVGGELRLCLPQVLNTVLRDFSLQQINSVCDQLYLYCSRCDASQLHVLKVLGILPPGAPSCGLITLTDAQRLCNTLLHPGESNGPAGLLKGHLAGEEEEREVEEAGAFWVEHQCLGKCQGLFVPCLYASPGSPCIRCSQCRRLYCPERFVMHSHWQPDKRTCHWGFDSAKWACYLQLGRRYQGTAEEAKLKQLLETVKLKFCSIQLDTKQPHLETAQVQEGLNLCSGKEKLCESSSEGKAVPLPSYVFDPCLLANLKEDPRHHELMWQSWYLYMHDKLANSNMSSGCVAGKDVETFRAERLGSLLKHGHSQENKTLAQDGEETEPKESAGAGRKKTSCLSGQLQRNSPDEWPRVSIETPACEKSFSGSLEENKDSMVVEVLQMYNAQHEKLQSTLRRQQQLEKELQALRRDEAAEQRSLHGELEVVQTEHAQKLGEVQEEQRKLKCRLEQLRQQGCRCREQQGAEQQQESHYATQLSELRKRLDRAEEDREELQEELRREREAREKLERTIAELKQQMKESVPASTMDSPLSSSSDALMSPTL
ncbi:SKI-like proto-oncogene b [Pygocentrus nattereri]|uniref:c-SKI SMAD4-binding domain-containing protein n=1 Tax=Pygocentrus nattereri TaxID=42514 RepID=A0A3B4BTU5_PYGNA|nr:SKI-like proto-oncogene b [Pygocentrus nattereri]XP_017574721.1 SKI-like proto-oncogene b [Pygocentrus nattereri]